MLPLVRGPFLSGRPLASPGGSGATARDPRSPRRVIPRNRPREEGRVAKDKCILELRVKLHKKNYNPLILFGRDVPPPSSPFIQIHLQVLEGDRHSALRDDGRGHLQEDGAVKRGVSVEIRSIKTSLHCLESAGESGPFSLGCFPHPRSPSTRAYLHVRELRVQGDQVVQLERPKHGIVLVGGDRGGGWGRGGKKRVRP